ncbi:MAG: hypothetical protein IPN77_23960, partial [Sandaracinaceae bacterium]|nr:hypothetical protein [Sandaracinaceae bacterium]
MSALGKCSTSVRTASLSPRKKRRLSAVRRMASVSAVTTSMGPAWALLAFTNSSAAAPGGSPARSTRASPASARSATSVVAVARWRPPLRGERSSSTA